MDCKAKLSEQKHVQFTQRIEFLSVVFGIYRTDIINVPMFYT